MYGQARRHVLMIDHDADSREVMRGLLWAHGFHVLGVDEGEGALAVARAAGPALVIAELYVPTDREQCVVRALKRDARLARIPLLVFTARVFNADREWAASAGCNGFLPKPSGAFAVTREVGRLTAPPTAAA